MVATQTVAFPGVPDCRHTADIREHRPTTPSTPFSTDSVSSGAEVRAFTHITYGLMERAGEWYLGQRVSGGSWTPAVGPLRPNRGLAFAYLDETGITTATATEVAMIVVSVRTGSDVIGPTGNLVMDSVTVRIHTRN